MSQYRRDLQEMAVIESLPLRQSYESQPQMSYCTADDRAAEGSFTVPEVSRELCTSVFSLNFCSSQQAQNRSNFGKTICKRLFRFARFRIDHRSPGGVHSIEETADLR